MRRAALVSSQLARGAAGSATGAKKQRLPGNYVTFSYYPIIVVITIMVMAGIQWYHSQPLIISLSVAPGFYARKPGKPDKRLYVLQHNADKLHTIRLPLARVPLPWLSPPERSYETKTRLSSHRRIHKRQKKKTPTFSMATTQKHTNQQKTKK